MSQVRREIAGMVTQVRRVRTVTVAPSLARWPEDPDRHRQAEALDRLERHLLALTADIGGE